MAVAMDSFELEYEVFRGDVIEIEIGRVFSLSCFSKTTLFWFC